MSFSEYVLSARFNQKTIMEDLFVKGNHRIPPRKQRGKTIEDSRWLSTEAEPVPLTCGADQFHLQDGRPVGPPCQPPVAMSILHRLKDYISVVYSSQFDPRA